MVSGVHLPDGRRTLRNLCPECPWCISFLKLRMPDTDRAPDEGRPVGLDNMLIPSGPRGANSGSIQLLTWKASKSYI